MNTQRKTLAQFNNISLSYGDKNILENISRSISAEDKIGLIGINGSGKSSLLKCIAGIVKPDFGNVNTNCIIEYVPQLDLELYRKKIHLNKYIEEIHEDWWQVLNYYENLFKLTFKENQLLNTLSGGELVKLNIIIALCKYPGVILLDEPTNHIDLSSINKIAEVLQNTKIAFIVVSHNIGFLNSVVKDIWEIEKGKLNVYGGNYDFYRSEKDKKIQSQINEIEVVRKRLKKKKASLQKANIRFQKEKAKSDKKTRTNDRSMPKIVRNLKNRKMQTSFGSDKAKKTKQIQETIDQLNKLKIWKRKLTYFDFKSNEKKGLIVSISNGVLKFPNKTELIKKIDFDLYQGDRVAILGDNGLGKTTFVKQLSFKNHNQLQGKVNYGAVYRTLYIDQKYDLVNPDLTLLENIQFYNNSINYETVRNLLGNMLFRNDWEINKSASTLSGGEIARLAFAIVTIPDIDVLILDEPTNNLDIETVRTISRSLLKFQGTIVAISHDMYFLEEIGITKYFLIDEKLITQIQRNDIPNIL